MLWEEPRLVRSNFLPTFGAKYCIGSQIKRKAKENCRTAGENREPPLVSRAQPGTSDNLDDDAREVDDSRSSQAEI